MEQLLGEFPDQPWLYFYLAFLEWGSDSPQVPERYAKAARLFHERGELGNEILARRGRAGFLLKTGELEKAGNEIRLMKQEVEASLDLLLHAWVKVVEADHLTLEGHLDAALTLLSEAEAQALEAEGSPYELKRVWLHLAFSATYSLGRYDAAEALLLELKELAKRGQASHQARVALFETAFELAAHLPTPSHRESARQKAKRSLRMAKESEQMALVGRSLAFLGQLEEPAVGRLLLHECLNLPVHQEEGFRQFPDCLRALAELEARAGNLGQAEVHLAEADRLVEEFEDGWTTFGVELARARIRWLEGDVEAGRAEGLKIIEGIEELRLAQDSSAGRMGVLAARWEPYLWLAGELLAAHPEPLRPDLELAFDLVERQRAQTLQESLAARLGDLYAHTSNRKPTLALIEETLDEETALLSFQLSLEQGHFGESLGGSWVLVVTREGTRAIPLADRLELEPLVESLVDLGDPSQAEELLMRLYDLVLAEALEALPEGVEELVLIPDGVLHRLPFEILRPVSGAEASVGNRFRISYQPSAGLWLGWKSQPRNVEATNPVLVFADPELPARGSERDPAILSGDPRCEGLPPLAAAREEGRNVLERLGETGHLLQGEEASETALKAESLGRYSILHFAAHACTLPNQPDQSAILLTPGAEREDGRLTSADILDLQRVPPMVVLAACRTADGKLVRGEGVISLVRAFFAAGARVVVASQNDLPDRETSRAVDSFYGYLSEGSSVGEALHRVRRKSIQAGAPASVWGSLRVMGDAEWIPFPWGLREPEPSPSLPAYVPQVAVASLGLLVLSLMGSSYVRRSRRRE